MKLVSIGGRDVARISLGCIGMSQSPNPGNIRTAPEGCLKRLRTDHIDLYHQHRIDPATQIEDTVGALSDLVRGGKVGYIGLSEAAPETIRRAHGYSRSLLCNPSTRLWTRDPEAEILPLVRPLGIGFVAYSPLRRSFLTGQIRSMDQLDADDFRRNNPRFVDANFQQNMRIVEEVEAVAREAGATHAQVALAWLLTQGDHTAPIPGTTRVSRLEEHAAADEIELTTDQLACLSAIPPPVCDRYTDMAAKRQMCLTSAALGAKLRRSLEIRR